MREFEGFMHGINLGGWLSQKDSNRREYVNAFITENDIANIARMHLDHIRIPLDYLTLEEENGRPIEEGYEYIDRALDWCRRYGLHVVLNLHDTHGYDFSPYSRYIDGPVFFYDAAEQERFYRLWERIVRRYASDTDIVAFELLNEIIYPDDTEVAWDEIATRAYKRVRAIVPDAWIIVGGIRFDNKISYPALSREADRKTVINFQCFEPLMFTHQKAYWVENMPMDLDMAYPDTAGSYVRTGRECRIDDGLLGTMAALPADTRGKDIFEKIFAPIIEMAERYDAPVYCSEYGVCEYAPMEDIIRWYADISSAFDEYGIGRAAWNYKGADFGLIDPPFDEVREDIVKKL